MGSINRLTVKSLGNPAFKPQQFNLLNQVNQGKHFIRDYNDLFKSIMRFANVADGKNNSIQAYINGLGYNLQGKLRDQEVTSGTVFTSMRVTQDFAYQMDPFNRCDRVNSARFALFPNVRENNNNKKNDRGMTRANEIFNEWIKQGIVF
jgi:hypothetical protein